MVKDLLNLDYGYEIIHMEHGYAVVRFYSKEHYLYVLEEEPWIIMGNYLYWSNYLNISVDTTAKNSSRIVSRRALDTKGE